MISPKIEKRGVKQAIKHLKGTRKLAKAITRSTGKMGQ